MAVVWTETGMNDLNYWQSNDRKKVKKIKQLLLNMVETPFSGIGKPEPLKHDLQGLWSRRIDREHRLIYFVENEDI